MCEVTEAESSSSAESKWEPWSESRLDVVTGVELLTPGDWKTRRARLTWLAILSGEEEAGVWPSTQSSSSSAGDLRFLDEEEEEVADGDARGEDVLGGGLCLAAPLGQAHGKSRSAPRMKASLAFSGIVPLRL